MKRNRKIVALFILSTLVAGCSEDRTVDEYQREKLQKNLALYKSLEGQYTGVVISTDGEIVLGAMQLNLAAEIANSDSAGGETTIGKPILVGNIRFLDKNVTLLSAPNGFYDPNTGVYNAQISILRENGSTEVVNLTGVIKSETLFGELSALKYPESGGKFRLVKNGPTIDELLLEARGEPSDDPELPNDQREVSSFLGETKFKVGVTKPTRVVILQPVRGTSEDFLDLISPVKTVQLSFNFSQSLHVDYQDAILDTRQGLLTGVFNVSIDNWKQRMNLNCIINNKHMNCRHITTSSGVTAVTEAQLENETKEDPADDGTHESNTKTFVGEAVMSGEIRKIKLIVTQPTKGLLRDLLELFFPNAEKIVVAAISFTQSVSVSIPDVKWDSLNGILDGQFSSGRDFTAYLKCDGFYFLKTNKPFACRYWTTRSSLIEIQFTSPYSE